MEKQTTNSNLYIIITILCVAVSILGCYIFFNQSPNENEISTNNTTDNTTKTENTGNQDQSVRTYRFFGYTTNNGPDMYTTLKLYSNGKYDFYVNNCEGVNKLSGTYTETETSLTLNGEKNIIFPKKSNGNELDYEASNAGSCGNISGSFMLESYMLNAKPSIVND